MIEPTWSIIDTLRADEHGAVYTWGVVGGEQWTLENIYTTPYLTYHDTSLRRSYAQPINPVFYDEESDARRRRLVEAMETWLRFAYAQGLSWRQHIDALIESTHVLVRIAYSNGLVRSYYGFVTLTRDEALRIVLSLRSMQYPYTDEIEDITWRSYGNVFDSFIIRAIDLAFFEQLRSNFGRVWGSVPLPLLDVLEP